MGQSFMNAQTVRDFDTPESSSLSQLLAESLEEETSEGTLGPNAKSPTAGGVRVLETGGFTEVDVENHGLEFASEWRPSMETPDYIGETEMLLEYLKRQERLHRVTMPIQACGIDPILFSNVKYLEIQDGGSESVEVFEIPSGSGESANTSAYELIKVDSNLYMSCITECLDRDYLNSVIAEATSAVKACGSYVFQMVGYKKLALEEGKTEGRLLNTLKLNSYEMSVLISYMSQFEGITISYRIINGKQCICFVKE